MDECIFLKSGLLIYLLCFYFLSVFDLFVKFGSNFGSFWTTLDVSLTKSIIFLRKTQQTTKTISWTNMSFPKIPATFLCPCLQWITNQFFMWVVIQFFSQVWSFADRGVTISPTKKRKWRFYRWHSAYFMSYWHLKRPGVIWILAKKQFGGKIFIRSPVFLTFLNFAA